MDLRSQIVTLSVGRCGRRYLPYAFTEQGAAMLSSVLNSDRAIDVNIAIGQPNRLWNIFAFLMPRCKLRCNRYLVYLLPAPVRA
jgi:hypothetical protein